MQPPIQVVHLFPIIDSKLIDLLKSLDQKDWYLPTLAKQWTVKDVAAHLLDTNMRTISIVHRHQPPASPPIRSYQDLVNYLNGLNAEWVQAMKRVSPQSLIEMLEITGRQYSEIMAKEPLFEQALFGVAWAGEEISVNWFHIAREYTEKVHHQLQIRHAVNQEAALMTPELYYPFIDTFMYGLPHALRNLDAIEGNIIRVIITGDAGGNWFVARRNNEWRLEKEQNGTIVAGVSIEPGVAWKLFTKGMTIEMAAEGIQMDGNKALCEAILRMVAVMA